MSDDRRTRIEDGGWRIEDRTSSILHPPSSILDSECSLDEDGHCVTCSDEALPGRVLSVDQGAGLALVAIGDSATEVDISLVDAIAPGDRVLVHGGVALERLEKASDE